MNNIRLRLSCPGYAIVLKTETSSVVLLEYYSSSSVGGEVRPNLNGALLHAVLHNHPSIVLIHVNTIKKDVQAPSFQSAILGPVVQN